MAVLRPLKVVIDELPGGADGGTGGRQQSGGRSRPARGRCRSRGSCTSNRTTSWRIRPRSSSAWPRAARSGCATPTSSAATKRSRTPDRRTWSNCAARTTRPPAAADAPDGRKVKATLHWVSAEHAVDAEVRLYDHLFAKPDPVDVPEGRGFQVQPQPRLAGHAHRLQAGTQPGRAAPGDRFQFERLGYFCVDSRDSRPGTSGLQPHGDTQRRVDQGAETRGAAEEVKASIADERRLDRNEALWQEHGRQGAVRPLGMSVLRRRSHDRGPPHLRYGRSPVGARDLRAVRRSPFPPGRGARGLRTVPQAGSARQSGRGFPGGTDGTQRDGLLPAPRDRAGNLSAGRPGRDLPANRTVRHPPFLDPDDPAGDFLALYRHRHPRYEELADLTIDLNGLDPTAAAAALEIGLAQYQPPGEPT